MVRDSSPRTRHRCRSIALFLLLAVTLVPGLSSQVSPVPSRSAPDEDAPGAGSGQEQSTPAQSEVELVRYYQERILETVHWALATSFGLLVTVIALVVGLGWYTNFRLYRRDIDALEERVTRAVRKVAQESAAKAAKSEVGTAMGRIKALQAQMLRIEAERWEKAGVIGNAVYSLAEVPQLLDECGRGFEVPEILEEMKRLLNHEKVGLAPGVTSSIQHALARLQSRYPADVKALQDRIERLVAAEVGS